MAYIVFCYNCKLFTTVWDWHCIAMCPLLLLGFSSAVNLLQKVLFR